MNIVKLAVNRPVAIAMFTAAILLFGMVSLSRLSVNLLPELSYPTLTIRTDYEGAAPAELEQLVSKPIEEAVHFPGWAIGCRFTVQLGYRHGLCSA